MVSGLNKHTLAASDSGTLVAVDVKRCTRAARGISVLVRFTGHIDATLSRWLMRAGVHSEYLHTLLFVQLTLPYLQVDELYAPSLRTLENGLH